MVKKFEEAAKVKVYSDNLEELREAKKDEALFAKSAIYLDKTSLGTSFWAFTGMTQPQTLEVEAAEEEGTEGGEGGEGGQNTEGGNEGGNEGTQGGEGTEGGNG